MSVFEKQPCNGQLADSALTPEFGQPPTKFAMEENPGANPSLSQRLIQRVKDDREIRHVGFTFLTTLSIFGIFLVQGVLLARILGPLGRGEFGTAIYFPRDILLYAGLLGGIEIVNSYASRKTLDSLSLKYSAAWLGLFSGLLTAGVAAVLSVATLLVIGKAYLVPFCLLCCVFVPWEHVHLTVSAVDRGEERYGRYNFNRFVFAIAFPLLLIVCFGIGLPGLTGLSPLWLACILFVVSKVVGLLPTLRGMSVSAAIANWKQSGRKTAGTSHDLSVAQLLSEGKYFALSTFLKELFERLDVFLIVALCAVEVSGLYFVAVPAAALLIVAPNALGVFTFNAAADQKRVIRVRQAVGVMAGTAVVQILATIVMMLLIPYLIVLVYGSDFENAIPFAIWLLPASAIRGFLMAVEGYLNGRGKPLIGVWSRALSIFVMIGFVWMAYSTYAELSIPMAACVGQAVSMVIISTFALRDVIERQRERIEKS